MLNFILGFFAGIFLAWLAVCTNIIGKTLYRLLKNIYE